MWSSDINFVVQNCVFWCFVLSVIHLPLKMALKKGRMESRGDPWRTWCTTASSTRPLQGLCHGMSTSKLQWGFAGPSEGQITWCYPLERNSGQTHCLGPWETIPCDSESFCLWHPERVSADHFLFLCTCGYCMSLYKHLNKTILDKKNSDTSAEASPRFLGKLCCSLSGHRNLHAFAKSLFHSVYVCSMASPFLYKCCHLGAFPPDCSPVTMSIRCKEVAAFSF